MTDGDFVDERFRVLIGQERVLGRRETGGGSQGSGKDAHAHSGVDRRTHDDDRGNERRGTDHAEADERVRLRVALQVGEEFRTGNETDAGDEA